MKICITPRSIQLLATYFNQSASEVLQRLGKDVTYDEIVETFYSKALSDFADNDFTAYSEGYVLQHLTILPQILANYDAKVGNSLNSSVREEVFKAKENIFNASQSSNSEDLALEVLKMAEIVGVTPIEIVRLKESEHFDAVSWDFSRSILQDSVWDIETGYKENTKDPAKVFESNVQSKVLEALYNKSDKYRFKLVPYSSVAKDNDAVDTTDYGTEERFVMVIVGKNNSVVKFNEEGFEDENGQFPIFKIKTERSEFDYQVKAIAISEANRQDATVEQTTKFIEERLNAHLENVNNAISKVKDSKDVFFEMDLGTSSKGFVELNEKYQTPVFPNIRNIKDMDIYVEQQQSRHNAAMMKIPHSEKPIELKEKSLDQLSDKDRNILINLFFNNNLKDVDGNPMTKGMRTTMIQRYVRFNPPGSKSSNQRAVVSISFKDKGKSNEVSYVYLNGQKLYPSRSGVETNLDIFSKAFDTFASTYIAVPTPSGKKVPGRDVANSIEDVKFNKQYFTDVNGELMLAAKPDISFGLVSSVDKSLGSNANRMVVASIVDDVFTLVSQNIKDHIIANSYVIAMPTKTKEGLILRGHGAYIGFNPIVSNIDIDVTGQAVFRSLVQNNLLLEEGSESKIKKGAKFAKSTWNSIKRESKETKQAMKILQKMLLGQTVTSNEKKFLKAQSGDMIKGLVAVALQGVPLPIPITSLLVVAGRKYNLNILPSDQQYLLEADEDIFAESWYKDPEQNPLGQILNLNVIDEVNERGEEFIANFVKDSINLFKGHSKTDLYHETFHAYFRGMLNESQRKAIYDEARNIPGSFDVVVDAVKSRVKFSEAKPLEIEEYLAEEFRSYARGRSKYNNSPKSKIAQFFERLLNKLKSIFGNKTVNEVVVLNKMQPLIQKTFKDIYEGNYDASKFVAPTSIKEANHSFEASKKLKMSYQDMSIIMSSVQSLLSDYINTALNSTSTNDSIGAVMTKMVKLSTLDINSKDYESISDSIKDEIHSINSSDNFGGTNGYGVFLLNENPTVLTYALNYVKESLNQRLELYKNLEGVIAKKNVKLLSEVLNKFGDTTASRESFKGDNETVLGVFFSNYDIISTEEIDSLEIEEDEYSDSKGDLSDILIYGKTGAEFSPFETADTYTKQLLSSIIKYNGQGEGSQQTNRIGVGRPLSFEVAIGKVVRLTKGLTKAGQMYNALKKAGQKDAEIAQIVLKLGNPSNPKITRSENRQWTAFWSSIFRASQDVRNLTLEKVDQAEGEESYFISKTGKFKEGSSIVGREWKGNFSDNLELGAPYIEDGLLNPTSLIEYFEDLYAEDLELESMESLMNRADSREIIGRERMGKVELIKELSGRKWIPLSGIVPKAFVKKTNPFYHSEKLSAGIKYKRTAESFYTANPFPLLKAMGIILPETEDVRNMLSYGDASLGVEPGIMNIINNSFSNRENAANDEDKLVDNFEDLFKGFSYSYYNAEIEMDDFDVQPDISGYLTMLKGIAEYLSDEFVTSTSKNANGDSQSTRPYHSTLSLWVAELNNAKNDPLDEMTAYDRLISTPGLEFFDYKKNPQIAATPWIVGMFQLDDPDLNKRGVRREDISITIDTLGGTIVKYGSVDKGVTSISSDSKTKYNTDFQHTLKGRQEIFRTEAKATSLTIFAPQFVRDDAILRKGAVINAEEVEYIFSDEYANAKGTKGLLLYNQFVGHLEAELVRINRIKELEVRVQNGEEMEFDQSYMDRGKRFYMFDNIFRGKHSFLVEQLLNKGVVDSFTLKKMLSNKEAKTIENALVDYFKLRSKQEFEDFSQDLVVPQNLEESFKVGEESKIETKKRMVNSFVVNNFLQNANFAATFLGDVALYDVAGLGFNKRIAGLISTGTGFRFDEDQLRFINSKDYNVRGFANKHAKAKGITLEDYTYQGYLNTGIMREAKFQSAYRDHYDTFFEGEKPEETVEYHKEMEVADAQAVITFDAYRMLAESNNDWSTEQEDIYNMILNDKKIDRLKIKAAFPVKKYQIYGGVTNDKASEVDLSLMAFHKYSILPLLPDLIKGTPLEDLNNKMMENGMDYLTMESASKLSTITKLTRDGNSEADNIYDKNREITKVDNPFTINRVHVRSLKNQVSVNSWYKGRITLWTQMRSMISLGLISDGVPMDYKESKAWDTLSDSEKLDASPFWTLHQEMHDVVTLIEDNELESLIEDLGLTATSVTTDIGEGQEIVTTYNGDTAKLAEYIQQQMREEEMLPEEMAYIVDEEGKLKDLSLSINAEKIEKILTTMVDKRLRRLKTTGEGLVQVSGTMLEKKGSKPTEVDLENYGTNGLTAYYHKDGSIKSMQVKIALQGDFKKLLKLPHPDKKSISVYSEKELDFNASLNRLNEAIRDESWLEKYREMISIVGPRIPSQQENSLESAIIAEFLIPDAGPIIILPEEIVAKTGSDFDHDKLMMMFSSIVIYGRGKNISVEIQKFDRTLKGVSKTELKQKLIKENDNLSALIDKKKKLKDERDILWDDVKDVRDGIKKMTSEEDKLRLEELSEDWAKWNGHLVASKKINSDGTIGVRFKVDGVTYNYKDISDERRIELSEQLREALDSIEDSQKAINDTYIERINALQKSSKDISPAVKSKLTKNANNLSKIYTQIELAEKSQETAKRRFNGKSTKGLMNEFRELLSKRITMSDNMSALVQNNSTYLVRPVADSLERLVVGPYDKYNRGVDGFVGKDDGISPTTIYDYRFQHQTHQENSVAIDSLGIAAVMSTFHAMFLQMNAKLRGVSKADQKEFEKSLVIVADPKKYGITKYNDAMDFIDGFSAYTLKFKHNFVKDGFGRRISLGKRTNIDGQTISSIIGQLINGYVDVAKDAWIFNAQGNKENTPVLLFLILAGVPPKTAILFTSSSIIRDYTRLKIEMGGVFSNLNTNFGESPIVDRSKIINDARAEIFSRYSDLINKNMDETVTYEDAKKISNSIDTEYDDSTLKKYISTPRKFVEKEKKALIKTADLFSEATVMELEPERDITWEEFGLFAHYLDVEDMSNDLTRFTSNTKFSTNKISSLSDATGRIIRTGYAKKKKNAIPNDWYSLLRDKTLNGIMNKDKFYLELLSKYFKLRNHPMVTSASVTIKPPIGVEKTVFQNNVKNHFISFLAQNSLYNAKTYNGVTFVKDKNDDAIIDYDPIKNTYTYGINTLREQRNIITKGLTNAGNANKDLLNKFPTDNHFIRYDIEYKKLQVETWDMDTEEIIKKYYYAYSTLGGTVSTQAMLVKMALYRSDNNIAMYDYRMGMSRILAEIKKKHPTLSEEFDLIHDMKRDDDDLLSKSNLFLYDVSKPKVLKTYRENYSDLINSKIPEVAEFFQRFSVMALLQTGMNRTGKYDLLRIVNNDIFETIIAEGVTIEKVFKALDEAQAEKDEGNIYVNTKYLDVFTDMLEKKINDKEYRLLNKGTNWITDNFKDTVDGGVTMKPGQVKAENIHSKGSAFAKKLTNPGNTLKVIYKETTFRNAEHAYQTYKSGEFDKNVFESNAFKPQGKPANKKTNFQTMVEILTAKLEQHPSLVEGINQRGGLSYIEQSTHNVTGDKFWESKGQNKFIEALAIAYNSLNKRLVSDLQGELSLINNQKVVQIGSDVTLTFEEEMNSIPVTLEEVTKKGNVFSIKVQNAKGKTYTYMVDKYGFGEKASLELKDNEVLFIDELYKNELENALGKFTQPTSKVEKVTQEDVDNLDNPCKKGGK